MSVESTTREVRSPGPAAAAAGLVAALLSHVREEKRSRGGASGLSSVVCTDPVAPSAFSPRFVGEPSVRGLAPSVHRSPWGLRDAPAGPRVDRGPGRGLPRPSRRGAATRPDAPQECSEEVTSSPDAVGASRPGPRAGPFRLEGSTGQQESVAGPSATRSNGLADKICRLSF